MNMKVSVIITTFRRPALLVRAVRSVFSQSVARDVQIELIVHDDDPGGSCEGTGIDDLFRTAPRSCQIVYMRRPEGPGGVAKARNRALESSSGEWVLFLDDDDALEDGAIEGLLAEALRQRLDFVAGGYRFLEDGVSSAATGQPVTVPQWSYQSLMVGNLFPIGSFLMRRSSVASRFNPCLATHEDWLFLLDNLEPLKVGVVPLPVLTIFESVSEGREQRNKQGGNPQKAADYLRIYSLYPDPDLFLQRCLILQSLGGVSIEQLLRGKFIG